MNPAILLKGGLVVDGSGAPAWTGDVLLRGDRIAAMGPDLNASAAQDVRGAFVLDCAGLAIAPGFIDVHTHDDAIVLHAPDMTPKLTQGITTVITGNCGISLAPYRVADPPPPLNLLGKDSYQYDSFSRYAHAVDSLKPAVNVASLIGHTTLRFACMDDLTQPASPSQLQQMCTLLDESLQAGALGLSSGLFYEQAMAAPMDEVLALALCAARHGAIYTTHLRDEMQAIIEALHEAGDTAFKAGVPLVISHHKCAGPANWGRTLETLPLIESLAKRQAVAMDVYPYLAGSTVLREDLVDGVIDVMLSWSTPHPHMTGRMLADIAKEWGVDQKAACRRLQPGGACYFQIREDDVQRVISHPLAMIGSDGLPHDQHPHPRLWGAFPRVLARYWRDQQLFSLEQAVYKMTGLSARNFRLHERGQLLPGWFADVVVFDPNRVRDVATYENPIARCEGIERVFVNGEMTISSSHGPMGQRAGRMLRRQPAADKRR